MTAHRTRRSRRRVAIGIGLVGLSLATASCGKDDSSPTLAVPEVFNLNVDAAAGIAEVDASRANVLPAEKLRETLEQGLTWHGITLVEVMRAARRNDPGVKVWIDALAKNTTELTTDVGLVYGPVGARAFNQQWAQHTQFLVDYAVAIGHHDTKAAAEAKENLADYAKDSGSFFATATNGGLPASLVQNLLATHVQHMFSMIDADQASDVPATVGYATTDGTYLSTIAKGLSTAIAAQFPAVFPGSTSTPASEYCTIVTTNATGYLESLLITGNADDPSVRTADTALGLATSSQTSMVLGFATLPADDVEMTAATVKSGLDHAISFAVAHTPASAGTPAG